jgi:hypothetical protein
VGSTIVTAKMTMNRKTDNGNKNIAKNRVTQKVRQWK